MNNKRINLLFDKNHRIDSKILNLYTILRNEKGRSIRILCCQEKKKKNKRHKYSEFQHADRSFDLVANKFLPPFSDSPSLCKGKPRPFSPPSSLPLYSSVAAKRCIPLSASFSHLLVSQGISSRINEGSTRFRRGRRFFWRGLHSPNGQSRAHQTECGIPSR